MISIFFTGLALGFVSSLHCVGMCGPLALSLPIRQFGRWQKIFANVLYNLGRVATYTLLGLLFGLAGKGFYLVGWQQAFSLAIGVTMLSFIVVYFIGKRKLRYKWIQDLNWELQKTIGRFLQQQRYSNFFLLGLANGLLPCGMVYVALGAAMITGNTGHSTLFMAAFGFATIPAMLLLTIIGTSINIPIRNRIKKITPFVMAIVAMLLITRGLGFNSQIISSGLMLNNSKVIPCH